MNYIMLATLLLAGLFPSGLLANPVGGVVGLTKSVFLERNGSRSSLEQGNAVVLGDVITTGPTGQIQLLFADGTKIAISPNSRLVIESILFSNSNIATEFAVKATAGAYRFISGNSASSVYSINTPVATMGIRGTAFDFVTSTLGGIRVATFRGQVELCNLARQCFRVRSRCSVAGLNSAGQFMIPENVNEEAILLSSGFPYIENQRQLPQAFRTQIQSCASGSSGAAVTEPGGGPNDSGGPSDPGDGGGPNDPGDGGGNTGGNSL